MIKAEDLVSKFRYAIDNNWGYIWGTAGKLWTQQDQNNSSRDMTVKYGARWIGHYVADCSGLFRWAFKQLGSDIHHGSNLIFDCDCTKTGTLSNGMNAGQPLAPGTAVFTGTKGDHGHIGLYAGDGKVIEAKGTQAGVVESNVTDKKWTWWGLLKNVEYGDMPKPDPDYRPTLRKGDAGPYVTLAQTELIQRGYDLGSYGADGKFGAQTEKAVKQFQRDWDLKQDGVIGPKTWAMLESTPTKVLYTVTVPGLSLAEAEKLAAQYPGSKMSKEAD